MRGGSGTTGDAWRLGEWDVLGDGRERGGSLECRRESG